MNNISVMAQIGLALPAGLLTGAAYFLALRWVVGLLSTGRYVTALLVHFTRFAVLAAVFFLLVDLGAAALLSGAVGLMLARQLILRLVGSAP